MRVNVGMGFCWFLHLLVDSLAQFCSYLTVALLCFWNCFFCSVSSSEGFAQVTYFHPKQIYIPSIFSSLRAFRPSQRRHLLRQRSCPPHHREFPSFLLIPVLPPFCSSPSQNLTLFFFSKQLYFAIFSYVIYEFICIQNVTSIIRNGVFRSFVPWELNLKNSSTYLKVIKSQDNIFMTYVHFFVFSHY